MDNPLSLNRYTYTTNNPLRYVDPSGHVPAKGVYGADEDRESRLHYIYMSNKDMDLTQALNILSSKSGKYSQSVTQAATLTTFISTLSPDKGGRLPTSAKNIAQYAKFKEVLKTWEVANPLIESLVKTGKLPSNYITKAQAEAYGWKSGKAVGSWVKDIPNAQIGGDVFDNIDDSGKYILPMVDGRVWFEADVGLVNTMGRNKQPGTRLLYSNDGEMWITTDHYDNLFYIGSYWDKANMT